MSEIRPVALGIQPPNMQQQAQMNPLGMMNTMSEIMLRQNELRMQQNLMAGQARFGEIMGTGQGSIEDRFMQTLQDPIAAAYAMRNYGEFRQGILAMTQTHEIQNKMNVSGMNSAAQAVFAVAANPYMTPEQFDQYAGSRLAMLDPTTRQNAMFPITSIRSQLFDGLENMSPDQRAVELRRRAGSLLPSLGASADDAFKLGGVVAPQIQYVQDPVTLKEVPKLVGGFGPPGTAPPPGTTAPPLAGPTPAPAPTTTPATPTPAPTTTPTSPIGGLGAAARAGVGAGAAPGDEAGGGIGAGIGTEPVGMYTSTMEPPKAAQAPAPGPQLAQASMGVSDIPGLPARAPKEQVAFQDDLNKGTEALGGVINTLNIVQDQLERFTPGRGTEFKNRLATLAETAGNALGLDSNTVKSWGEKIRGGTDEAAQDTYMSLLGGYAMTQLKDAISGTGRAMLPEVRYFMEHLSAETNPRAVWDILNNARVKIQKQLDASQKWPDFLDAVYNNQGPMAGRVTRTTSPLGYPTWYGKQNFPDEGLPPRWMGYELAPRDPARMYKPPTQAPGTARIPLPALPQ